MGKKHRPKFSVGDRIVVEEVSDYHNKFALETGEVIQTYFTHSRTVYGVKLDRYTNEASAKGLYWFGARSMHFETKEREENIMFNDNFRTAEIQFIDNPNSGVFSYALYDDKITEGDIVIVSTGHHGFSIAKVVSVSDSPEDKKKVSCGREVVCIADFSAYEERKNARKRAVDLKREMDNRIREFQQYSLYEAVAERDPAMKNLLDEFKSLTGFGIINE